MIDVQFPVLTQAIPADHGYVLYSALTHLSADLHDANGTIRIAPINGQSSGNGMLVLDPRRSSLRFRLPPEKIPMLLLLAGKKIDLAGHPLRLGVPRVQALEPAASLRARLVCIKGFTEAGPFLDAVRRQLDQKEIRGEATIPLVADGPHVGKPVRRILKIKDKKIIGFALLVTGLTATDSIRLQELGIGGRQKMGCGFFMPHTAREDKQ